MPSRERFGREPGSQGRRTERHQGGRGYQESGWRGASEHPYDQPEWRGDSERDWSDGRQDQEGNREPLEDFSERRGYRGTPGEGGAYRGQGWRASGARGQGSGDGPGSQPLGGNARQQSNQLGYGDAGRGDRMGSEFDYPSEDAWQYRQG